MKLSGKEIASRRSHQMQYSVTASLLAQAAVDETVLHELELYIENTAELHPQKMAIVQNYAKKLANGTYNPELAAKGWLHWVDLGAKRYMQEFGSKGDGVSVVFSIELRRELAKQIETHERSQIEKGEYQVKPETPAPPAGGPTFHSVSAVTAGGTPQTKEDFIAYLEQTLVPDLKEEGKEATADDFESLISFMEGLDVVEGLPKAEFLDYLKTQLIPDLKESGAEETAKDFETGVAFIETPAA